MLSSELETTSGLAVEISDAGSVQLILAEKRADWKAWWEQPWSLPKRYIDLGRAINLTILFLCSKFLPISLRPEQKDDFGWKLAYAYEFVPRPLRKRLIELLDVDKDLSRRGKFHHWLNERGVKLDWLPRPAIHQAKLEVSLNDQDVLVLPGASWCYIDFDSLKKLKEVAGFKLVCFVYDLLPIDYPSFVKATQREQYKNFILGVGRLADLIVTPNQTTLVRLKSFLKDQNTRAHKIVTISLMGASLAKRQTEPTMQLLKHRLPEKKFILCIAPLRDRKHVLWLYALFEKLHREHQNFPLLVLAGKAAELRILRMLSADPAFGKVAMYLEEPTDEELSWLYSNACLCLCPSFEGGLGMTVAESLNFGRPCIASNAPSLVEASGGSAIHLGFNEKAWCKAILNALQGRYLRPPTKAESGNLSPRPEVLKQISVLLGTELKSSQ